MGQTNLCHHPPPSTTSQHSPALTSNQKFFYKKTVYKNFQPLSDGNARNLTSRPEIAKKLFFKWRSPLFLIHTQEISIKILSIHKNSKIIHKILNYKPV